MYTEVISRRENMEVPVSLLLGSLAILALYKVLASRSKRLPPGPRGLSALLSVLKAFRDGSLHKQAKVWHQQYGDLVLCRTVLGDFCFLNSARLVRDMFASKEREQVVNDRPETFFGWYVLDYKDVGFSDQSLCPDWPKIRRIFHFAIKATFSQFYGDGVERFESTVQTELRRLTSRIEARAGEEVDVDSLLTYSLLCVLHVLLSGECPKEHSENLQIMHDYAEVVNEAFDPTVDGVLAAFPFLRFIPGTYYRDVCCRIIRTRDRLTTRFFAETKATHTPGCQRGIVDMLLDEQLKGENHWLTDEILKMLLVDIIAAGYLTSFNTLKATFLFLVHNPEVMRRIQTEVDSVLGDRPAGVADRGDLPYTEAVVMETLRCSPILPTAIPHFTRTDVSLGEYTIPKKCAVFANLFTLHRDPEVFPGPDLFQPERLLDDVTGHLLPLTHPVRQSLLPFGVGRRSCPGENFARTRIFLYVTTLLQHFDILPPVQHQLPPPDPEFYNNGLLLEPKPYHLIFRPRKKN